ncbi:hypothetical protein PLESTF_001932500 [Pleodorina starrii]|nr:hypothetical protein PLESTF_001932500 [Pleodorina starrii]
MRRTLLSCIPCTFRRACLSMDNFRTKHTILCWLFVGVFVPHVVLPAASVAASSRALAASAPRPAGGILKALKNFYLQLPTKKTGGSGGVETIMPAQLKNFSNTYFFVKGDNVVLFTPSTGATTSGSSHPRTELREVEDDGRESSWGISGKSTRTLKFSGAVTQLGSGKQAVVIAQVKAE